MAKWKDKGYWKSKLYYWQSLGYYYANTIRFGSFGWFSAANPAIPFGGMLEDEKSQINELIPELYKAKIYNGDLLKETINYPVFVKPDTGLKGFEVHKVDDNEALRALINSNTDIKWIAQEYIKYESEYSILYHRVPGTQKFDISSFIEKKYPYVIGDGESTLEVLIHKTTDPYLVKQEVLDINKACLGDIIPKDELFILHNIGNYARGAKFFSLETELIPAVKMAVHQCMKRIEGVDFCRLDIKADSIEGIIKGDYKVIELNGAKSEPLHIYDKDVSFVASMATTHKHWKIMKNIVKARRKLGFEFPKFKESYAALKGLRAKVAASS
jgi:hypothetical protein